MSRTPTAPPPPAPEPEALTAGPQGRQQATKKSRFAGLPWILPAMVVSVGVLYYCIGYTGYISTLNWDGASPQPIPIGLNNYSKMFADPVFYKSLSHTVIFFVVTFTVQVALGMTFAVILHSGVKLRPL
jgi:raffinose/stachyose/melibiose transport system permease protein